MTTLTITWKAPATDTASAYTVQIFSDTGDTTFSGTAAGSWADLPWNDSPDAAGLVYTPAESTYTYTTPVLTPGTATGGSIERNARCNLHMAGEGSAATLQIAQP